MTEWAFLLAGFVAGALLAWVLARARAAGAEAREAELRRQLQAAQEESRAVQERLLQAEKSRTAAETHAAEMEKNLAAQRALLDEARTKLADTFRSLAAEALARNVTLAEQKLRTAEEEAAGSLRALLEPLSEALAAYQRERSALDEKRVRELVSVNDLVRRLSDSQEILRAETSKLANALRSPQARGRWGEMTLRRTAELAGMSVHCDFAEQETAGGDGRQRPDMVVKLPAGRQIVVDSKVPLDGFLDAIEAVTEVDRQAALARYSGQVSRHIANLASKEYWDQFPAAPEFVVLFMPSDSFLAAAAEQEPNLLPTALSKKIIMATPSTFIALLLAVAYGWRQETLTENAQRVSDLGQEIYDRLATLAEHFNKVGGALGKAVESYNAAVGSLEMRVFPTARKFKELGAGGKKELEDLQPIDQGVRTLAPPEVEESR